MSYDVPMSERKLVLVDDDPSFLAIVSHKLKSSNWQVESFESEDGVVDYVSENPVDCVVLDYRMPRKSGIELAQEIRAQKSPQELTIVLMSAAELERADRNFQDQLNLKYVRKDVALSNDFSEVLESCCRQ